MEGAPHFELEDFTCHCGCGRVKFTGELLAGLELLRSKAGLAVRVIRGFSCKDHNLAVGGVAGGQHPEGTAADVVIPPLGLQAMYELAMQVEQFKNGGIGVYAEGSMHVDTRGHAARWARIIVDGKHQYVGIDRLVKVLA